MDLIFAFNTTDENDTPDSTWLLDYYNGDLIPEYGSEPISGNDYNEAFEGNDHHHNPIQPQVNIKQKGCQVTAYLEKRADAPNSF